MSRRWLIVFSAACLTACGSGGGPLQFAELARAPEIPPGLGDKIDGVYKGYAQPVVAASPMCPTARWGVVEVGDRTLYFAFTPQTIFITPIQPDGTVRMVSPSGMLAGRLDQGRLLFSVKNPVCETSYDLRWVM